MNKKSGRSTIMIVNIQDDIDLRKIAESGQCFRWTKDEDNTWRIISADQCTYVTALDEGEYLFECDAETYHGIWESYFDLETSYRAIRDKISSDEDPFLYCASEHEKGIRILRQDPWEMLVSFIISQNRNIPAIQRSIELLAGMCGELKNDSRGEPYYAFPSPAAIASLSEQSLKACKLGYRWKYIQAAAHAALHGGFQPDALRALSCEDTVRQLTSLYGVGHKVASCIALFGLHQLNAFPRDVWVNRILANEYPDGYPYDRYSPYNGVYQQYMFAYYRHR